MDYKLQNKTCQNCRGLFTIESGDFNFYEKIKVPPPTFCPWCRFIRRMAWRNDRALYKRTCDLCKKNIISTYPENTPFPIYCMTCWYSDNWDPASYGRDYDFSKPFFEQFNELFKSVPQYALFQRNSINCDYSNMVGESRNVYLSVSVVLGSENVFYSKSIDTGFNIVDCLNMKHSEQCYENTEGIRNYNSQHLLFSRNCIDSYFLIDCANCSNCFMCSNLRNKQFYIRNKKYPKEEYEKEVKKINLGSRNIRQSLIKEFQELSRHAIYRYANIINSHNSTGNNLLNMKNSTYCFDCYDGEDFKYCNRNFTSKDCMDCDYNMTSELMYEYITGGRADYNVKFSYSAMGNVKDADYTHCCFTSTNLFGCVGLRNKENAILNKVYSKEEFIKLRAKIIEHMNEKPYVDKGGRVYKYGEYFPMEISPFAYNETPAQDFETLTKTEAIEKGYHWKDIDNKDYNITIKSENIPDDIREVKNEILNEALECEHKGECNHQCFTAFRITQGELQFYKQHNIPLPSKCANCRFYERFAIVPLPKLYKRTCVNCDKVEFETPYAPERPEKIYCESCYNKEIY